MFLYYIVMGGTPEVLNALEERHIQTIREIGDDPADWLAERQIEHLGRVLASRIERQPPSIRERYADAPARLRERMQAAAKAAFSRYEQLPRFSELLVARDEVEASYAEMHRRLDLPPKVPYYIGTIHRGNPAAVTDIVRIEEDRSCQELIVVEGGLFAYFSSVSQAFCHLLGETPFSADRWLASFVARDSDAVSARLHAGHRSVRICADAMEAWERMGWLSTQPDLELSDEFHHVHEKLTYGPMIQFVFAHEFAHLNGHMHPTADVIPPHKKEQEADSVALNILSESMCRVLSGSPAFSMWPAWTALAALRALRVSRRTDEEPRSDTHPTFKQRVEHLTQILESGANKNPRHASVLAEAREFGELAYRWTSEMLDLAHEVRRSRKG